ncbi:cytochrome P450 [Streptomyces sp. NPDC090106]|uniref:cytochrome P450 n=1 Tax=Streptomyces sp. NPDC090106 TaxID=3365946 RepID=UPI0037FFFF49
MPPTPRDPGGPVEFRFGRLRRLSRRRPVRTVRVDGEPAEFLTDPALVRRVLVTDGKLYGKGELFQKARILSRAGLLAPDDSQHRHYRRLAHPYLRTAAVAGHAPLMERIARDTVAAWRPGRPVDVQAEMGRAAARIALATLLGTPPHGRADELAERLAVLSWEMSRKPLHGRAARRQDPSRRLARAFGGFRTLLASHVADALTAPAQDVAPGYLSALLADAGHGDADALGADEICAEAVMMLVAATVTTASVMSWSLYLLAEHPLVEEKVLKDLARTAAEDPGETGTAPAGHGHGGPPGYTLRFLTEVLRLYPPVWVTCRKALTEVALGERTYPAGTHVMFSSYFLHRDPVRYPDPHRLDPDRWLTARPTAHDGAYLPFGAGARGCVGEAFAWRELEILLGTVAREWRLTVPPGSRITASADTTLHPRRLVMIPQPR